MVLEGVRRAARGALAHAGHVGMNVDALLSAAENRSGLDSDYFEHRRPHPTTGAQRPSVDTRSQKGLPLTEAASGRLIVGVVRTGTQRRTAPA